MRRIAQGDGAAFETLYRAYEKPVGQFLFRLCYDRALAEDGLQEVFLRVWKSAPRWRGESKVSTFLFQVAKNYGLNARAKAARQRARLGGSTEDHGKGAAEPAASGAGPGAALEGEELRAAVRRALQALPEDQRLVVHLAQTEGLTYREVGEILQLPVSTVKSRMAAAAETLRRKLERHARG